MSYRNALASLVILSASLPAVPLLAADDAPASVPATKPVTAIKGKVTPIPKPAPAAAKTPAKPAPRTGGKVTIPPAVQQVINKAVADCRKEFQSGELRRGSSYFADNPAKELSADIVFSLLDTRMDSQPAPDAYIKWQFLSALPRALDDQYRQRAVRILANAAHPEPLPGMISTPQDRQQMNNNARRMTDEEGDDAIRQLEAERDKVRRVNDPVFAYRNELLKLSPEGYDTVVAAFTDAWVRAKAGEATGTSLDAAAQSASRWLQGKPSRQQVEQLDGMLRELRNLDLPEMVDSFKWDDRQGALVVQTRKVNLNAQSLQRLQTEVDRVLSGDEDNGDAAQPNQDTGNRRRRR